MFVDISQKMSTRLDWVPMKLVPVLNQLEKNKFRLHAISGLFYWINERYTCM